jgi:hypothetical protein
LPATFSPKARFKFLLDFPLKAKFKNLSAAYCPEAHFEFFAGQSVKSKIQKFVSRQPAKCQMLNPKL